MTDNCNVGNATMSNCSKVTLFPGILNQFDHVPAIQSYKDRLKQGDRNNNGGEVGDEGDPIEKQIVPNAHWRVGGAELHNRHPVINNEIPRKQMYNYQADYDNRKEEEDG